ncbi:MAG: 2'-5' RNA ligase family protein [Deltaproteobacteria bacterium]|nr:2'-5' RNA ligase family protein [Deltaproteobacteria bacterium]
MGYAVEMFLRDEESPAIRQLFSTTRSVLADIGTTPHVSLAVFEDVDVPKLIQIVRGFAARIASFRLRFSSVGTFPGRENVVFLAPVVTGVLLRVHTSLHEQLAVQGLSCHPHYLPGLWVPHCAVTVDEPIGSSLNTIKAIHDANVLGEYTIDNVNVVEFRPVVTLASFGLRNRDAEPSVPGDA